MTRRDATRAMHVGSVALGGGAPVSVQTMANRDPHDAAALIAQTRAAAEAGADIVRLTVPDAQAASVLGEVRRATGVPLVADIHFDYKCALAALEAGADALRLNPGNIGGRDRVRAVARAAAAKRVPIRIGVNGGSLEKDILEKYGSATSEALVESALRHVALLEAENFRDIVISVKASDVPRTLAAYRLLAEKTDCPLHVGLTEAGTFLRGTVHSSVALGVLLAEGIGDTVRVSLTDDPVKEVKVGLEILRALGLKAPGASVTSCPTCGRTKADVFKVAAEVEDVLEKHYLACGKAGAKSARRPHVAVMGCVVNGPGEARHADIALCGAIGEFMVYEKGVNTGRVSEQDAAARVLELVERFEQEDSACR